MRFLYFSFVKMARVGRFAILTLTLTHTHTHTWVLPKLAQRESNFVCLPLFHQMQLHSFQPYFLSHDQWLRAAAVQRCILQAKRHALVQKRRCRKRTNDHLTCHTHAGVSCVSTILFVRLVRAYGKSIVCSLNSYIYMYEPVYSWSNLPVSLL